VASRRRSDPEVPPPRPRKPATTPEGRENQLVALAVDLAEKQLREGTASAQVISHFLKAGSMREELEREKIQRENELLKVRAEATASAKRIEELYIAALDAMRMYQGQEPIDRGIEYDD